jgi:pimeloyl-ACP methyl ester carboxylesterase
MRITLLVVALMSSVLFGGCAQMRVTERQFLRPDAPGTVADRRFDDEVGGKRIAPLSVAGQDGALLNGILLEQPNADRTVLYFGGNMFHIDQHLDALVPVLADCGTNVAVFDYRGYGRSSGKPTVANMQADALAIFDALNARFPGRVIVHGQSLGSFMAAYVAQARPVLGTVLETTATSVPDLIDAQVPWYARPFLRLDIEPSLRAIDNRTAAARFTAPALVIAGGKDKTTPAGLGVQVFDAVPRRDKQLLLLENAGHNDALQNREAGAAYCRFVKAV